MQDDRLQVLVNSACWDVDISSSVNDLSQRKLEIVDSKGTMASGAMMMVSMSATVNYSK